MPQQPERREPRESSRPPSTGTLHVDPADTSLLERNRATRSHQKCGELAKIWFVANDGETTPWSCTRQFVNDAHRRMPRRQDGELFDRRPIGQTRREQLGRLPGAHKGTRPHLVHLQSKGSEAINGLPEPRDTPLGQRPEVIVRPFRALLGRDCVPHEV